MDQRKDLAKMCFRGFLFRTNACCSRIYEIALEVALCVQIGTRIS